MNKKEIVDASGFKKIMFDFLKPRFSFISRLTLINNFNVLPIVPKHTNKRNNITRTMTPYALTRNVTMVVSWFKHSRSQNSFHKDYKNHAVLTCLLLSMFVIFQGGFVQLTNVITLVTLTRSSLHPCVCKITLIKYT